MCRGEGDAELATSLAASCFRGVMKSCSERCPGAGLLLELNEALSSGIPKRGGVGLDRYLLGGVKDGCKIIGRLVTMSGFR